MLVSFHSNDVRGVAQDFSVIGITGEVVKTRFGRSGEVIAHYEPGRTALKLREYIESHHYQKTGDGKIVRKPVDGWDDLVRNATTLS